MTQNQIVKKSIAIEIRTRNQKNNPEEFPRG